MNERSLIDYVLARKNMPRWVNDGKVLSGGLSDYMIALHKE